MELWRRARVVGSVTAFLSLWVVFFDGDLATLPGVSCSQRAVFLLGPYAGPFVGLFGPVIGFDADPPEYCLTFGIPLLAMIATHPLRPSWASGLVSTAGLFVWFVMGLSFIHQASA